MQCKYCSKEFKNAKAVGGHMANCRQSPTARPLKAKISKKQVRGTNKGASFHSDPIYREKQRAIRLAAIEAGALMSPATRELIKNAACEYWSDEQNRKRQSDRMKQVVVDNLDSYTKSNVVGRVRNIEYNGHILKGSWELITAQAFDAMDIVWVQPTLGIPYRWNDSTHTYFPDFFLPDFDRFIEVKGYERERDRAKWAAVPNLTVLKVDAIRKFQNGNYEWFLRGMVNEEPGRS